MNKVFAFIVGIEKYDQSGWDILGPCVNALAIAEWCVGVGVPPQQVFLFLDPKDGLNSKAAVLQERGVNVKASATFATIDTFLRRDLAARRPANSRLLFYWSGHGFVENDGTRILICRDYTADQLKNRVFNASLFLRNLLGQVFQSFTEQIFVADVCGVYSKLEFAPDRAAPGQPCGNTKQAAYFATPEGKYAKGSAGRGVFTDIALNVLNKFREWPHQSVFQEAMKAAFVDMGQTPFHISVVYDGAEAWSRVARSLTVESAKRPELQENLLDVLVPVRDWCKARNVPVRTNHWLQALLQLNRSDTAATLNSVLLGAGDRVREGLAALIERQQEPHGSVFIAFEWGEHDVVQRARAFAVRENSPTIVERHVLMAILSTNPPPGTVRWLQDKILGPRYAAWVEKVNYVPKDQGTPGL